MSRVAARVLLVLAVVATLATVLAQAGGTATARLRLDGVPFRPEVAKTPTQRSTGLMNREQAPVDGMLFVFPSTTTGGFWMKNTLVPLTIVFFDSYGERVRRLSMKPCRTDSCPIYVPGKRYRFALELPAGDKRPALKLAPRAELRRLIARSS